jgi:hypothetical protein
MEPARGDRHAARREVSVPAAPGGGQSSDLISAFDLPVDRRTLFVLRSRNNGEIWQITPP